MERFSYFVRRILLVIPTFLGITVLCFTICQLVPGGPVEQAIAQMRGAGARGGMASATMSPSQIEAIKKHYGFDKPIPVRYWNWLVPGRMGLALRFVQIHPQDCLAAHRGALPISLTFGISGFVLTYLICVPLGIAKALRNGAIWTSPAA